MPGQPMPTQPAPAAPRARRGRLFVGVAAAACLSLASGWWLGQLQRGDQATGHRAQPALQRQADQLLTQLEQGKASEAEQRRLLELLIGLDRRAEATVILERLADQQPQRWSLRLLLAELRRDQGDRSGAEREVRQLLNLHPDRVEGLQLMALLQLETGRGSKANAMVRAALERARKPKLRPEALPIGLLLAQVLQRQQQNGQAESLLRQLADTFPNDQRPLMALAMSQQERGDLKAAQQSLATARARRPDRSDPQLDALATAWGLAPLRAPSPPPRQASSSEGQSP